MTFLNNIRIKKMLIGVLVVIGIFLVGNTVMIYRSMSSIGAHMAETKDVILPHAFRFMNLKMDIIQIQQWLTDISATKGAEGFDDGFNEAANYYKDANRLIDELVAAHKASGEKEMVKTLEELRVSLDDFYRVGKEMAGVYIKEGYIAGNQMMEKFDPYSAKLQKMMETFVAVHVKEVHGSMAMVYSGMDSLKTTNLLLSILLFVVVLIGFGGIDHSLKSIRVLMANLGRIAKLDFREDIPIKGQNEIGEIAQMINQVKHSVSDVLRNVKGTSSENASISSELLSSSIEVGRRAEDSERLVFEVVKEISLLNQEMERSSAGARESEERIVEVDKKLQEAAGNIKRLSLTVQDTAQTEVELAQKISQLSHDAEQVKEILVVISEIAEQTNLLALNAAIEAARAGEHGRGFAVVADEVRKLAERTQKSLTEINATITVIVQAVGDASEQMTFNSKKIQALATISNEVEAEISSSTDAMHSAKNITSDTIQGIMNRKETVDGIARRIKEADTLSKENARSFEEVAGAAEHLNKLTSELNSRLEVFKT